MEDTHAAHLLSVCRFTETLKLKSHSSSTFHHNLPSSTSPSNCSGSNSALVAHQVILAMISNDTFAPVIELGSWLQRHMYNPFVFIAQIAPYIQDNMLELAVAALLLFIVHWLMKRRDHFNFFKKCGIPGPTPNIIFGNILEMYKKSPTKAYREWIEKYGDVVGYFNGYRPVVLVADLDLLRNIQVKDFQDFTDRALLFQAKRPGSPQNKGLLQLTSTRWKEVRSVLTPSFTTSKLKMMSPGVISAVEKLVSKVDRKAASGEEFEAGEMYAALALDVICKSAMGIDYNLQDQPRHGFLIFCRMLFGCAFSFIAVILSAFPSWESGLRFINSHWLRHKNGGVHPFIDVQEKCKRIVTQRQQDSSVRRKDLLQLMIDAKDAHVDLDAVTSAQLTAAEDNDRELQKNGAGGGARRDLSVFNKAVLDDDDITQNAFVVLVGGFETTSNTMALVTHMLVHHPEVQEKVREELLSVVGPDVSVELG
ncbi:hypothetical protein HPB51_013919 [Rhipicephalus microplus]|uniref:Cytochrome n=1 Tax=Rhipicephalus microplus TaxID=6941 RepID=A0A9J6DGD4_RHIMP|nr:hypothetical protein HPB51_013919 [Rhipicephalus microplus]